MSYTNLILMSWLAKRETIKFVVHCEIGYTSCICIDLHTYIHKSCICNFIYIALSGYICENKVINVIYWMGILTHVCSETDNCKWYFKNLEMHYVYKYNEKIHIILKNCIIMQCI